MSKEKAERAGFRTAEACGAGESKRGSDAAETGLEGSNAAGNQEAADCTATALNAEPDLSPIQLALAQCMVAASNLALIDESLLILSQKRRTLEEKAITRFFHRVAVNYAAILSHFHELISTDRSIGPVEEECLHRLRTVNENIRNCVEELLKILKYDFNFLEQYFEYDYCSRLLQDDEMLPALESICGKLGAVRQSN